MDELTCEMVLGYQPDANANPVPLYCGKPARKSRSVLDESKEMALCERHLARERYPRGHSNG